MDQGQWSKISALRIVKDMACEEEAVLCLHDNFLEIEERLLEFDEQTFIDKIGRWMFDELMVVQASADSGLTADCLTQAALYLSDNLTARDWERTKSILLPKAEITKDEFTSYFRDGIEEVYSDQLKSKALIDRFVSSTDAKSTFYKYFDGYNPMVLAVCSPANLTVFFYMGYI